MNITTHYILTHSYILSCSQLREERRHVKGVERGQYRGVFGRLRRNLIKGERYRVRNAGIRSCPKKRYQKMSLNKAIETQFLNMRGNDRYTAEQIEKFAHRWTMRRRRKREFKICLD
jgi:hypothetical protein